MHFHFFYFNLEPQGFGPTDPGTFCLYISQSIHHNDTAQQIIHHFYFWFFRKKVIDLFNFPLLDPLQAPPMKDQLHLYKPKHSVPNAHPCQLWNDISTNGCQMTSDTKNPLDLWPGELKMVIQYKNNKRLS